MVGRSDVAKMLESPEGAEEFKKKQQEKALPVINDEPANKKAKIEEIEEIEEDVEEEITVIKEEKKRVAPGKEAAMEAEVRAARERAVVPLDIRKTKFKELLEEKKVSAFR